MVAFKSSTGSGITLQTASRPSPTAETLEEGLQNIFLPHLRGKKRVRYREYVHPRPWTAQYAWVPFVPVNPHQWFDNCSYMGRVLSKYPPLQRFTDESGNHHGWAIPCENEWSQLEADLYKAIRTLSAKYQIPCSYLSFPTPLATWKPMLKLAPDHSGVASEEWLPVLHSAGISLTFVDGIHNSLVYGVDQGHVRRSGVVLDLLTPPKGQPNPNWFITMGVPSGIAGAAPKRAGTLSGNGALLNIC
ncbi:hypothetical protein FA13DRAFT_1720103 [Coprinellus micaceus]|uniref:Uncharacterized protein n=1 Tax=Coprinellus micaceus TaxID=71717 RepID=A0A4Y7S9W8_COPMI|nr:hypothetical protein FA13DRAFT_1720103 [Coprinellus micaceus]